MTATCVILDIGGVLEITPETGWVQRWEEQLELPLGAVHERLRDVWQAGSVGSISEREVHEQVAARLGLDAPQVEAFMADLWAEYLGKPNEELIAYVQGLRGSCRLGILSNSFVGAREREQAAYGFEDLVEEIVYSHEAGFSKPDPRIYALICTRLNVPPGEMIFLDDAEMCVAGARDVGIHAIRYQDNAQAIAEIEKLLTSP